MMRLYECEEKMIEARTKKKLNLFRSLKGVPFLLVLQSYSLHIHAESHHLQNVLYLI